MRHCGVERKRRWGARTAAIAAVIVAALWTQLPLAGADIATTIPPGRIISLIPSDDEVSQYVGIPVRHVTDPLPVRPRGGDHLDQRDECRALAFTNSEDVWGTDYAAFRGQVWNMPSDPDRIIVGQAVATFPGTSAARDRFNAVYNPNLFNMCNHAEFRAPSINPGIMIELYDFKLDDNVIIWTLAAKYYGQYNGWNFVYIGWHLGNVMSISNVGQQGNPSQAVKRLTDHILDRVG